MLPKLFNYEGKQLRTVTKDGEPWFAATDICNILDIGNATDAVSRLDEDEKGLDSTDTLGGKQYLILVNEPGLYSLILGSRKPEAKAFKRWITHEVLPAIRKTGSYSVKPTLKQLLALVKVKREFFLLSGISKHRAYSKALHSVEQETGVDLSEFKVATITTHGYPSLDINTIIDALRIVISNDANVYRHRGDEYALIKEKVYSEFDGRGLSRKGALATLSDAGILVRTTSNHYAKAVRIAGRRPVRAIVVRLEDDRENSSLTKVG